MQILFMTFYKNVHIFWTLVCVVFKILQFYNPVYGLSANPGWKRDFNNLGHIDV